MATSLKTNPLPEDDGTTEDTVKAKETQTETAAQLKCGAFCGSGVVNVFHLGH